MRFALLLLLSVACAAAALEIEWLPGEQAVVFKDADGVFRSAKDEKACSRALRAEGSTIKIRWTDLASLCTAERSGQIGEARFAAHRQRDGSLLSCVGDADLRSLSMRGKDVHFSTVGRNVRVKGAEKGASSALRTEWTVRDWRRIEFEGGASMVCSLHPGAPAAAAASRKSKLEAPLAMAKDNKKKKGAAAPTKIAPVASKREAYLKQHKADKKEAIKLRVNKGGCATIPVAQGYKLHVDKVDLCIANRKEAACENVHPSSKITQKGDQVCVPNLREFVSEMHDRSARILAAEASSHVQLQVHYSLEGSNEDVLYNLRGLGPLGAASAKSVARVLAAGECDADSCDIDSVDDGGDFVIVTPVSNWVLITVVIVSAALFLVLIYFLVASAFRVNDQRTRKRRGE